MAVYCDELRAYPNGRWCHLWADSEEELLAFGGAIGLKEAWLQYRDSPQRLLHFDLRPSKRAIAISKGAIVSAPPRRKDWHLYR